MKELLNKVVDFILHNFIAFGIALSCIGALVLDEVGKSLLDGYPEAKLTIILVGVWAGCQPFLCHAIRKEIDDSNKEMIHKISEIDGKISFLNDTIPFSALDNIEAKHGRLNPETICEIWIISNMLQEANNDEVFLKTIYENISKYKVNYYYILPNNEKCNNEIRSLQSRLKGLKGKRQKRFNGAIYYRFDDELSSLISASYFDTVLYIDVDALGNPMIIGDSNSCEGFQCYTNESKDNIYFYQTIDQDKIRSIRNHQKEFIYKELMI